MKKIKVLLWIGVLMSFLYSCSALYSPYVFDKTAELKIRGLALLDKSTGSYQAKKQDVEEYQSEIELLVKQEEMRKHNHAKINQWKKMMDPNGKLLYGVLEKWKRDSTLNPVFVELYRKLLAESFETTQATEKQRQLK